MPDTANVPEPLAKKPVRFRRLRIAWSVFFAVLTVALCLLWVRSYWWFDFIQGPGIQSPSTLNAESAQGLMILFPVAKPSQQWRIESTPIPIGFQPHSSPAKFDWNSNAIGFEVCFPHWFAAIFTTMFAAFPWLPFRFSLRTMLIMTTLVAVMLGIIVWASRG